MPRILPTFAAIAVIGVCIAFNTARYPIIWEMVGPNAELPLSEKCAPAIEVASSAKAASSSTAAQNPPQTPDASPAVGIAGEKKTPAPIQTDPQPETPGGQAVSQSVAKENDKPGLLKVVPISLTREELAANDAKRDAEKAEKAESNGAPAAEDNLVEPPKRLVPVANDAFAAAQGTFLGEIRRLPPVEYEIAYPAGRYADEYPNSAIPIYPSTGR